MTPEERIRLLNKNSAALHNKTVTATKNALLSLMQEKAYADISMTDIILKSGVSRGGVYNTYKSKDEILLDIVQEPIEEAISALTDSIFDNMESTFRIGKKYESSVNAVIAAGLEHEFLQRMNKRFDGITTSYYVTLWNGMIYNAFIEWARAGMPGTVEEAVENVQSGLRMVAETINTGLRKNRKNA
ncbi:MAG: TetR/AcrR family transcriptional regulator [Clostridia bacterium]|nr:TetR/AcrR family transcriptional regulator [Clostridia bacterium]